MRLELRQIIGDIDTGKEAFLDKVNLNTIDIEQKFQDIDNNIEALGIDKADKTYVDDELLKKADKDRLQFKADNYKLPTDSPSTYDLGITEFFTTSADWMTLTGLTNYIVVKTEKRSEIFIKQRFFSTNGQLLKYRLGKDGQNAWGEVQTITTKADMEQKADKQFKNIDWKNETDPPTAYPYNNVTYFYTNTAWSRFPIYSVVKTTRSEVPTRTIQEVFTTNGQPLLYRLADTNSSWGAWRTIATTDKIDILCTANTGYTILDNKSYKINNITYINCRFAKTDSTAFDTTNYIIPFQIPTVPQYYVGLNAFGLTSGGNPNSISSAGMITGNKNVFYRESLSGVGQGWVSGVIVE